MPRVYLPPVFIHVWADHVGSDLLKDGVVFSHTTRMFLVVSWGNSLLVTDGCPFG